MTIEQFVAAHPWATLGFCAFLFWFAHKVMEPPGPSLPHRSAREIMKARLDSQKACRKFDAADKAAAQKVIDADKENDND